MRISGSYLTAAIAQHAGSMRAIASGADKTADLANILLTINPDKTMSR
jgi:hypothetical protein